MPQKILIIEDDKFVRDLITKLLAEEGFDISIAVDGKEGMKKIEEESPDLILLDLNLPDSQGIDTFYFIHDHSPQIPTVILTGINDEEIALEALELGAQSYLVKGQLNLKILKHTIRTLIHRNQLQEKLKQWLL